MNFSLSFGQRLEAVNGDDGLVTASEARFFQLFIGQSGYHWLWRGWQ